MKEKRQFMSPHEVPAVPGTEGWEEMYPRYYLFSKTYPEQLKYESSRLWFQESLHVPFPQFPLDLYAHDMWRTHFNQYVNRIYLVPPARGLDQRILNGYVYITPIGVENPDEIPRRAEIFERRAGHYFHHWDEIFERWTQRIDKLVQEMESIRFADLPDIEPESTITDGRGYGETYVLLREYDRLWSINDLLWQYHFELLDLTYGADAVYVDTMRKLFPGITDKAIGKTVAGFSSKLFRPPEELQKLAKLAVESGIADVILGAAHWEEGASKLKQSETGKKWLEQVEGVRYPWFEMSTGTGWYHTDPTWNQDLDVPLANLKLYIEALRLGKPIFRNLEEVSKERDRVAAEYRGLIKNEQDMEAFSRLSYVVQKVAPFAEDHNWYCSNLERSIFFKKMRDLGQIFANHGVMQDKEDIFYLNRYEIPEVLYDVCSGWALGVDPPSKYYWPDKIKRRKEIMEKFRQWTPPPALGPAPDVITEPFTVIFYGITTERLNEWLKTEEIKPEEVSELTGFAASAGVAEGIARVCFSLDDVAALKAGEILVTPVTSPNWAPVFTSIAGCVTDIGGIFCHAGIVCREYSLPAVVGTGYATRAIKTGDRIRVDGDRGVVTILERAR